MVYNDTNYIYPEGSYSLNDQFEFEKIEDYTPIFETDYIHIFNGFRYLYKLNPINIIYFIRLT